MRRGGIMDKSGGCLCGKVRFQCSNEPLFQFICHCKDCRKQHAGIFGSYVSYGASDFSFTSDSKEMLSENHSVGDSGETKKRYFCANCGSFIYFKIPQIADALSLGVGLFDDPSFFTPNMQFYCKDKLANPELDLAVASFDTYPDEVKSLVHLK